MQQDYVKNKNKFEIGINGSVKYLAEQMELDVNEANISDSWEKVANYFLCVDSLDKDNNEIAQDYLEAAITAKNKELPLEIIFLDEQKLQTTTLETLKKIYAVPDENEDDQGVYQFGAFLGNSQTIKNERCKIIRALEILAEYSPHYAHQVNYLIDTLYVTGKLDNGYIRSGSTVKAFGCIINTPSSNSSTLQFVEDLVHESSHLRLYLEQIEDEIVLNSDEARYPAPFRQDKRPMTGIYHAFYVLAHVCCCFLDLKQHKGKFVDCGDFDAIFDRAYARFTESSAIVKKYGQLTERGKSIFEQMNQEVQQRLNH